MRRNNEAYAPDGLLSSLQVWMLENNVAKEMPHEWYMSSGTEEGAQQGRCRVFDGNRARWVEAFSVTDIIPFFIFDGNRAHG